MLYGLTGGLALVTLLLIFAVFNVAVDQARLLRMTPGFIQGVGVAAGIAVAFVPQMVASWQAIREAQQVRGHKVRGVRDMLPLVMPLLVTALERAMQLAESMEARGFGGQVTAATSRQRMRNLLALLFGLAALGAGFAGLASGRSSALWPACCWPREHSFWAGASGIRDGGCAALVITVGFGCAVRPYFARRQPAVSDDLAGRHAGPRRMAVLLPVPALHAVADFSAAAGRGAHAAGDAGVAVAAGCGAGNVRRFAHLALCVVPSVCTGARRVGVSQHRTNVEYSATAKRYTQHALRKNGVQSA